MAYGQCQRLICSLRNKTDHEQLTTFENMLAGSVGSVISSFSFMSHIELLQMSIANIE